MTYQIQITDLTADTLKELSLKELAAKRDKLKILEEECKVLENLIGQLNVNSNESSALIVPDHKTTLAHEIGYNENWTWEDKIKFILNYRENKGLTTSEIVATLGELEAKYGIRGERSKAIGSISAILSTKAKDGKVFYKKLNERKENTYYVSVF